MKNFPVITDKSYREFPADHPFRRLPIMPSVYAHLADVVVCSLKGEPRLKPAKGDADIKGKCHRCEAQIIYRASAPDLPKECWRCYINRPVVGSV